MSSKPPKGTIDYEPTMMARLLKIIDVIRKQTQLMGAVEIDTPTMESTKFLLKKYGEEAETKLIYRLEKLGFEELSLRYDLTVPLQRYINNRSLEKLTRFQVGKVYRKDHPSPLQGRFREFIQADLDIVGSEEPMIPEAEIMKLIVSSLDELGLTRDQYVIRINFRDQLQSMIQNSGIDLNLFKSVCISIDKLDKMPWSTVRQELIDKGIRATSADQLKNLIGQNLPDPTILPNLTLLMDLGEVYNYQSQIRFDSSLARGLDYYTGLIYEVVLTDPVNIFSSSDNKENENKNKNEVNQSPTNPTNPTLIAGGRYDQLIKIKNNRFLPAIGVSFGVTRLEMALRHRIAITPPFKIFVVSQPQYLKEKLKIVNYLRQNNIQTEYFAGTRKNIKQINTAIKENYNYVLIYGENGENNINVKRNDQSLDQICLLEELLDYFQTTPYYPLIK